MFLAPWKSYPSWGGVWYCPPNPPFSLIMPSGLPEASDYSLCLRGGKWSRLAGGSINSGERIMYHCGTALIAGIIATVLVSGIAFMPAPAEAAKLSKAERLVLEKATAACKVEAKDMKFSWHWRKRQKYVRNCIIRTAVQAHPSINISEIRKAVNMMDLRMQRPG